MGNLDNIHSKAAVFKKDRRQKKNPRKCRKFFYVLYLVFARFQRKVDILRALVLSMFQLLKEADGSKCL
jgi:hypothetical protein